VKLESEQLAFTETKAQARFREAYGGALCPGLKRCLLRNVGASASKSPDTTSPLQLPDTGPKLKSSELLAMPPTTL